MNRIFLSCDLEGTCGIAHWDETDRKKPDYSSFAMQMSMEASMACEGALMGGAKEIFVRDAHDTARNIDPVVLPEDVRIMRGWGRDPYGMMSGVELGCDGVMFTGYHSPAGWDGNPLSHTMNTRNISVKVNGEVMSELMMNSLTAAMLGVPVLMVSGDRMLCEWFNTKVPGAIVVPVSEGVGNGSISIHPEKALRRIRNAAEQAMAIEDPKSCLYPMPETFEVEITYREHYDARSASWYPGMRKTGERTVVYTCDKWMDALIMFHFCL